MLPQLLYRCWSIDTAQHSHYGASHQFSRQQPNGLDRCLPRYNSFHTALRTHVLSGQPSSISCYFGIEAAVQKWRALARLWEPRADTNICWPNGGGAQVLPCLHLCPCFSSPGDFCFVFFCFKKGCVSLSRFPIREPQCGYLLRATSMVLSLLLTFTQNSLLTCWASQVCIWTQALSTHFPQMNQEHSYQVRYPRKPSSPNQTRAVAIMASETKAPFSCLVLLMWNNV